MNDGYDLAIVGGGTGGSALALVMARGGLSVLLLERTMVFEDRVRGEWIPPWGVAEIKRLGLYDLLRAAGAHHLVTQVSYDESRSAESSEAQALDLSVFAPGVPGPLTLGHPRHCQTVFDAAVAAGVRAVRGAEVISIQAGPAPAVTWTDAQGEHTARARLLVGADGRTSLVREALGLTLRQDPPHHMFTGLLVDGMDDWDHSRQTLGTHGEFQFFTFPQGSGRMRLYGSFPIDRRRRFLATGGPGAFLAAFGADCAPDHRRLATASPAGPLLGYLNSDSWTDRPFVPGAVLIGDAAGWNDPLIGQGLSLAYRDVREVSEILLADSDWSAAAFESYGRERGERLRRLRFSAALASALDCEFGPDAAARRKRYHEAAARDRSLRHHALAVLAGPDAPPPETFTEAYRARVLQV